jgi:hypothetical protein
MRSKELWKKLPDVELIEENLKGFWEFVAERQRIWYRRFVKRLPPPWTKDRLLKSYKFTNVYRELDYGTIWYMKHVVPFAKKSVREMLTRDRKPFYDKRINLLWLTVMYRLVNRVETFEEVGFLPYFWWGSKCNEWREKLEKRKRRGDQIFTNAHLTLPTHTVGQTKIDKYMEVLDDLHEVKLLPVFTAIQEAKGLEDVFKALLKIKCVGRFIAYEVCCDLILAKAIPFTENDWVNPGPGCMRGINLIWPRHHTREEYQGDIRWLMKRQEAMFKGYDLKFHQYNHPLTLRGIEHSLCEYQKYYKMQRKVGKQRMHFVPRDWGQKILEFK